MVKIAAAGFLDEPGRATGNEGERERLWRGDYRDGLPHNIVRLGPAPGRDGNPYPRPDVPQAPDRPQSNQGRFANGRRA
ncbi:hypothetical protein [Micromonospora sp. NPDC007230]|uniref:hypothetical protein n=1 Tax=Micromonospora sp. NPDC007230 TaxID=3364237 RepID=UPI0036CB4401